MWDSAGLGHRKQLKREHETREKSPFLCHEPGSLVPQTNITACVSVSPLLTCLWNKERLSSWTEIVSFPFALAPLPFTFLYLRGAAIFVWFARKTSHILPTFLQFRRQHGTREKSLFSCHELGSFVPQTNITACVSVSPLLTRLWNKERLSSWTEIVSFRFALAPLPFTFLYLRGVAILVWFARFETSHILPTLLKIHSLLASNRRCDITPAFSSHFIFRVASPSFVRLPVLGTKPACSCFFSFSFHVYIKWWQVLNPTSSICNFSTRFPFAIPIQSSSLHVTNTFFPSSSSCGTFFHPLYFLVTLMIWSLVVSNSFYYISLNHFSVSLFHVLPFTCASSTNNTAAALH